MRNPTYETDYIHESNDGVETTYVVTCSVEPFVPGKTWGDPDDCYPDEGGYVEDIELFHRLPSGKKGAKLSDAEYAALKMDDVPPWSRLPRIEILQEVLDETAASDLYERAADARADAAEARFEAHQDRMMFGD